eukprot:SAG22_NODE_666_length_8013_cov_2.524640_4_plen_62_part_00
MIYVDIIWFPWFCQKFSYCTSTAVGTAYQYQVMKFADPRASHNPGRVSASGITATGISLSA